MQYKYSRSWELRNGAGRALARTFVLDFRLEGKEGRRSQEGFVAKVRCSCISRICNHFHDFLGARLT